MVDANFSVLTPPPRLPLRNYFRAIGIANQKILEIFIKRAIRKLGIDAPILWTFLHQSDLLIGKFNECLAVYHCVDYWPWLLSKVFLMGSPHCIDRDERLTAAKANFVITTSRFLKNRIKPMNPDCYYVPNAADYTHFSQAVFNSNPPPADLAAISRPIIGFSGSLEIKSDVQLLREIAASHPDWNLVFIGITENVPDLSKLRRFSNVHLLGLKKKEALPHYFKYFDVCIVPFRKSRELDSISPLKIYEYLAAGRPVVATAYDEIRELGKLVYLSESHDQFIINIQRALKENDKEMTKRRIAFARKNTWTRRAKEIFNLISKHMH
jgi:glycosyltransferase involved in cell wall biosynthesis